MLIPGQEVCLLLHTSVFTKLAKSKVIVNTSVEGRKNIEKYFPLERKEEKEEKFYFFPNGLLKIASLIT